MSTNQKLELSREIRQWIGTGLSVGSVIFMSWMFLAPESFQKTLDTVQKKFK